MTTTVTYVYVAGIGNSEPEHWQRLWYDREPNGVWVDHDSWDAPIRDTWVKDLDNTLRTVEGPTIVIAHSLGCTVFTEWARDRLDRDIAGVYLVSPPNPHAEAFPAAAEGFTDPAYNRLPWRTVVVASENDPFGTLDHAKTVADQLGAELVNVGQKGHINLGSNLGDWPQGWEIFRSHFA